MSIDTLPKVDTICISVTKAIKLIRQSDSLSIMKVELDSTNKLVQVSQERIKSKDSTISDLKKVNDTYAELTKTFQADKENLTQQRDLYKEDMTYFRKLAKKGNAGTWAASGLGVIVVIASYLIFHK